MSAFITKLKSIHACSSIKIFIVYSTPQFENKLPL